MFQFGDLSLALYFATLLYVANLLNAAVLNVMRTQLRIYG